jgi:hypothetical protein
VAVAGLVSVGSRRAITRPITAGWRLLNQGQVSAPLSEYEWGQSGAGEGRTSLLYTREDARLVRRLVRPFYLKMYLVEGPTEVDPDAARRFRRKLIRAGRRPTSEHSFHDSLKVATDLQSDFRTARRSAWRAPLWRGGRKSYTVDP